MIFKKILHQGVKVDKHKERTKDKPVENIPTPNKVYIPMLMHTGKPAERQVKIGEHVDIGTLLGVFDGKVSASIHSSVSGEVQDILEMETFRGKAEVVIIKHDGTDSEAEPMETLTKEVSVEDFVERLSDAGITGKGGAGFPTSVKFDAEESKMKFLVVNGSECEPYSTTDHRIMVEHAEEVTQMMDLIIDTYSLKTGYIAIEAHMHDAVDAIKRAIEKFDNKRIELHLLGNRYPKGHSGLQIQDVTGIMIPEGKRAGSVGVLQSNVSTLKAMYDAFFQGKPFTRRVVTVTGPCIQEAKNLSIPMGTPVSAVIEHCGGLLGDQMTMINGGPMMGKSFDDTDLPVDKDTTTLLFLGEKDVPEASACIRCGRCIDVCPVALQPIMIHDAHENQEVYRVPELRSQSCISCGSCTYICPSNIPLLKSIQALNKQWEEMKDE